MRFTIQELTIEVFYESAYSTFLTAAKRFTTAKNHAFSVKNCLSQGLGDGLGNAGLPGGRFSTSLRSVEIPSFSYGGSFGKSLLLGFKLIDHLVADGSGQFTCSGFDRGKIIVHAGAFFPQRMAASASEEESRHTKLIGEPGQSRC